MLLLTHFLEYLNNPRFLGVIIILAVISLGILVYNKIKHSWVVSLIKKVVKDTCMRNGKFSRMSLMLVTSFHIANFFAIYDFIKNGFNFEVFMVYLFVALGNKGLEILNSKYSGNNKLPLDSPNSKETPNTEIL